VSGERAGRLQRDRAPQLGFSAFSITAPMRCETDAEMPDVEPGQAAPLTGVEKSAGQEPRRRLGRRATRLPAHDH
jgi:hypothetical protein